MKLKTAYFNRKKGDYAFSFSCGAKPHTRRKKLCFLSIDSPLNRNHLDLVAKDYQL